MPGWLALSASASLGAVLTAGAQSMPDDTVRVGCLQGADLPWLPSDAGAPFMHAGVAFDAPVRARNWAHVLAAFAMGRVDVVAVPASMAVWARFGVGIPAKVVGWQAGTGTTLTLAAGLPGVPDLGGRTVAVSSWYADDNLALQDLVRAHGLVPTARRSGRGPGQVGIVALDPVDMPLSLAHGRIAAYLGPDPLNVIADYPALARSVPLDGDPTLRGTGRVVLMHEEDLWQRPAWSRRIAAAVAPPAGAGRPAEAAERIGLLVHRMRAAVIDGDTRFLDHLAPARAARDLMAFPA